LDGTQVLPLSKLSCLTSKAERKNIAAYLVHWLQSTLQTGGAKQKTVNGKAVICEFCSCKLKFFAAKSVRVLSTISATKEARNSV